MNLHDRVCRDETKNLEIIFDNNGEKKKRKKHFIRIVVETAGTGMIIVRVIGYLSRAISTVYYYCMVQQRPARRTGFQTPPPYYIALHPPAAGRFSSPFIWRVVL